MPVLSLMLVKFDATNIALVALKSIEFLACLIFDWRVLS